MSNSLREVLETAFDKDEDNEESVEGSTIEEQEITGDAAEEPETNEETELADEDEAESGDSESEDSAASDSEESEPGDSEYQAEVTAARAPESWKLGARERWNDIPEEARNEILRREQETNQVLQESAKARRVTGQLYNTVSPYMPMLNEQNATPVQAIQTAFKTMSALAIGNPQTKAQTIAGLIGNYNVDIRALDSILAGDKPTAQTQIATMIDKKLAPLTQHMNQQNQQATQQQNTQQQQMDQELRQFAQSHEFFSELRGNMAHIMNMATDNGVSITMEQAYNKAAELHPEVSKVLASRNKQTGKADKRNIRKKKDAASSIKGNKRGDAKAKSTSLRGDLADAFDQVENG